METKITDSLMNDTSGGLISSKRSGMRLASDIILLISVVVVSALTIFSFAVPTTEIGGEVFYGKTKTLYDFLWVEEDSVINEFIKSWEYILDGDNELSIISAVMKMARLAVFMIPIVIAIIMMIVNLIQAVFYFIKEKSTNLGKVAAQNISKNLIMYCSFVFFGGISGGIGEEAYFIGYTAGKGMTIGMFIGIALLFASAVIINYVDQSNQNAVGTNEFVKMVVSVVGAICIGAIASDMKIYSIFATILSSSISTAATSVVNGFEFKSLIYPGLNTVLFYMCLSIGFSSMRIFVSSFQELLSYKEKKTFTHSSFVQTAVLALVAVGAIFVLRNPNYGYGWSVDIYSHFVCIFIVSGLCQTVLSTLKK